MTHTPRKPVTAPRPLRVLQLITGMGPGGAERLLLEMFSRSNPEQGEWRLVSIVDDLRALDVYGHPDVQVEVFDLSRGPRMRNLLALRRRISEYAPDVIHAHMFHSLLAAVAAGWSVSRRPKICFTSHLDPYPAGRSLLVRALKPFRDADVVFYASQHPSLNVRRTRIIPNGVDVPPIPPVRAKWKRPEEVRLVAVGRLTDQKDPLGLLRAVAAAKLPGVRLNFVGSGPMEDEARALADQLGLSAQVQFKGTVRDVRTELRNADIFVMHSKYEGMPMALLEAAAEAMPVICTPVGFAHELLKDGRGVVAAPVDFPAALQQVVSNPAASLASGVALHEHVKEFHSIDSVVHQHEQLYSDLVPVGLSQRACST